MKKLAIFVLLAAMVVLGGIAFAAQSQSGAMQGQSGATTQQKSGQNMLTPDNFDRWDTDKNNQVSMEEFRKNYTGQDAEQRFKAMDKNADNKLEQNEISGQKQQPGAGQKGY